jgi:TetR/AcrR family transcriptional regulator, cholesterol catabolism regulator
MAASKTDRKTEIRKTARRMFQQRGYAATSMRDLAKEVGIEAASLYNHISSKEELLQEMCFEMAEHFFVAFRDALESEKSNTKKLRAVIRAHVGVISQHINASSVFFHEWVFLGQVDLVRFKRLRSQYEQGYRDLLAAGIEAGDFKDVDVRITSFTILSALNATYDLYRHNGEMTPEHIADHIVNLLLKGLKK